MSFDRRWLVTAAGAVFLTSLFRRADGSAPPGPGPRPSGAKTPDEFFSLYQKGWPRPLTAHESAVARKALDDAYGKRFAKRFPNLTAAEKAHLEGFASVLGTLTYACLENHRKGTCGWEHDPSPSAKLAPEHVFAARELLGFYLNLPPETRCEPKARKVVQAEEPCPLCPMP